jgi:LPS-assembly lipoprotein
MWWPDKLRKDLRARRLLRLLPAFALAGLSAGCFQPLYGDYSVAGPGGASVLESMKSVDVAPLNTPRGTRLDRVGVEVRNDLIFRLTGGGPVGSPTHRLQIDLSSQQQQIIVDITSGRADVQNYGIDARYRLIDLATGKTVVNSTTFSRVSFDIPGQQQRFAGERGLRDAEDRAAVVIADHIRNRLASYFTAGT